MFKEQKSRQLFLMRHGEPMNVTFPEWISTCFDQSGKYSRTDLNMPECLPKRNDGYENFLKDSPTRVGLFQSEITGEAFKEAGLDVTPVYSSPSFRCIQTCDAFLKGCKKREQIKIKIEPGLFEWLGYYSDIAIPKFMTPEELQESGFNIDLHYKPFISVENLEKIKEQVEEYYLRGYSVTKHALNADQNGNILLVRHSSTVDVCSRLLIGKEPRLAFLKSKVPLCGFLQLDQKGKKWEITEKQILGMTHTENKNFDRKILE